MTNQELSQKFTEQWQSCRDWLLPLMQNDQPKLLTKDELRDAAMRELNVSKNAFDFGWIAAIEDTGQHDWYEPLRRRPRTKSQPNPTARGLQALPPRRVLTFSQRLAPIGGTEQCRISEVMRLDLKFTGFDPEQASGRWSGVEVPYRVRCLRAPSGSTRPTS